MWAMEIFDPTRDTTKDTVVLPLGAGRLLKVHGRP